MNTFKETMRELRQDRRSLSTRPTDREELADAYECQYRYEESFDQDHYDLFSEEQEFVVRPRKVSKPSKGKEKEKVVRGRLEVAKVKGSVPDTVQNTIPDTLPAIVPEDWESRC